MFTATIIGYKGTGVCSNHGKLLWIIHTWLWNPNMWFCI